MHYTSKLYSVDAAQFSEFSWWEWLFTTKIGIGWFHGSTCITGWVLLMLYTIVGLGSLPCVRRSGLFEVSTLILIYVLVRLFYLVLSCYIALDKT